MKRWALEIDVKLCVNCSNCILATKDEYVGNVFPGYSAEQPPEGVETIKIVRHVRGDGPSTDISYIPKTCNHCDDAPCIKAAGDGSIYKRPDGIVMIDPVKAKNRRDLVDACPYGMILWNRTAAIPQNWNFDASARLGWTEPRCTQACLTKAMRVLKLDDEELAKRVEEEGLGVPAPKRQAARIHRGLDEVLRHMVTGNICGPRTMAGGRTWRAPRWSPRFRRRRETLDETDAFGDFRFDGLSAGGFDDRTHPLTERLKGAANLGR